MITLKQLKSKLEKDFGWENLESDDNKWFVDNLLKDTIQAIEVIHCCKSDSELLSCKCGLPKRNQGIGFSCMRTDCDANTTT